MTTLRITLALFAFTILAVTHAEDSRMSVAQQAGEMIARFEQGKLRPGYDAGGVRADKSTSGVPIIGMGPLVTIDPNNVEEHVHLGVVELNGKDLASLGFGIFPTSVRAVGSQIRVYVYHRSICAELNMRTEGGMVLFPASLGLAR